MQSNQNVKILHAGHSDPYGRRVTLGLGTGLGLKDSVLLPDGTFWLGTNEAGHIGIPYPPHCSDEDLKRHNALMEFLHSRQPSFGQQNVNFESILTGKGVVNIYEFLHGHQENCTPEFVGNCLREGQARECLEIFAWYLGLFIGTVQLTFMPTGGIWMTGGVVLKNLGMFDLPDFWRGIEAFPSYQAERQLFPLGVLCNPEHALVGCAFYAVNRLLKA